jgi:hypothetical protein
MTGQASESICFRLLPAGIAVVVKKDPFFDRRQTALLCSSPEYLMHCHCGIA